VHFKEGDEVKSNALLFTIDPRPSQAALDAARAALARDQAQLENAKIQFGREQSCSIKSSFRRTNSTRAGPAWTRWSAP